MRAMAMSDTASSFYQWSSGMYGYEGLPLVHADGGGATTDSTIVTSSAAAVTSPTSAGSGDARPGRHVAGIQGPRVGKPASAGRKRSRASRRAPVTLLNTDAANFRAMVQQFTGIPAPGPFSGAAGGGGAPVISFAADYGFPPPAGAMSFDHTHHQRHPSSTFQDHQQLLRHHHHQQHQYTGGGAFGYSSSLHALAGDEFSCSAEENKMLLQSLQQAAQMPFAAPAANHSAINGYFA